MEDGLARLAAEIDEHHLRAELKVARHHYTFARTQQAYQLHWGVGSEETRKSALQLEKTASAHIELIEDAMRARGMRIPNPRWHGHRHPLLDRSQYP